MKQIKIIIDRDKCQSAATCAAIAPDVYKLDDEYKAVVKDKKASTDGDLYSYMIDADDRAFKQAIDGAKSCPFQAIEIYDTKGKKIYPAE